MKVRVLRRGDRWAAVCTHNGKIVDASLGVDETTEDGVRVVRTADEVLMHLMREPKT